MTNLIELKDQLRLLSNAERQRLTITAEELAAGYAWLRANAPARVRPYLSPSRTGVPPIDPLALRKEERWAMALFNRASISIGGGKSLSLVDYQMPLKAVRRDTGVGKVDLLGVCEDGVLAVIELKLAESREDRTIALLEGMIYAAIIEANLRNIAAEVEARAGTEMKAVRPRIFIVAPPAYWSNTRIQPGVEATASLAACVSALIETQIAFLSLEGSGPVSLGLDGSVPRMADDVALAPVVLCQSGVSRSAGLRSKRAAILPGSRT